MTNEQFYDAEIAPKLLELCNTCAERGMSFVAMVECEPGVSGETVKLADNAGISAIMARWGVKAHGNVDSFMIAAERHALKHGHKSAYLSMRGVPTTPVNPSAEG